jgi:hypothetical protein
MIFVQLQVCSPIVGLSGTDTPLQSTDPPKGNDTTGDEFRWAGRSHMPLHPLPVVELMDNGVTLTIQPPLNESTSTTPEAPTANIDVSVFNVPPSSSDNPKKIIHQG